MLFGVGLGVLLYGALPAAVLLLLDATSYVAAAVLIIQASRQLRMLPMTAPSRDGAFSPKTLSPTQRKALIILPALTLVSVPAMALLPVLHHTADPKATLWLLFARSVGQLLGPLVVPDRLTRHGARTERPILLCLAGFIGCYAALPGADLLQACALVLLAHLLSNMVFALGYCALLQRFDAAQVAAASGYSYRGHVLIAALTAPAAGWAAESLPAVGVLLVLGAAGWLGAAALLSNRAVGQREQAMLRR